VNRGSGKIKTQSKIMNTIANSLLCGILALSGCTERVPALERAVLNINGQRFEFVTAFGLFDNYIAECNSFGGDFSGASGKLLYGPLRDEIIDKAEAAFMFKTIELPYEPNELLKKEMRLLRPEELIEIARNALGKITQALPGPNTKIIFLPANPIMHKYFKNAGACINAITIGSGKIIVQIDPTFEDWKKNLPYVIAHEYHHSVWISRKWVSENFSLIEYLVFEGRADVFATGLYPDVETPWIKILNKEQERSVWDKIKNDIRARGHERIDKVMFGSDDIPPGSGYTIGYNIVASFKRNTPGLSDKDVLAMDPEEILAKSRYR
jgi:uncharacterized protein YjaZ